MNTNLLNQQRELTDALLMECSTDDLHTNREAAKLYNLIRKRGKRIARLCKRINKIS